SYDSPVNWAIDPAASAHCPRITGRGFRGLKNGSSPSWMAGRLNAVGQRPINALVDITNYVMIDLGRPLHAYDVAKINGDTLTIRLAQDGETLTALNEKEYELDSSMCIIADGHGADDLAGIMGGERTGVSDETTEMFLESAIFDPISVATTARKLNINSDARYRFERGLDVTSPDWVQGHVARLVLSICGGEASHMVTAGEGADWQRQIVLAHDKVEKLTGMDVPLDRQQQILQILGFTVDAKEGGWTVSPPPWRGDIDGAADLVEEIGRIHGYDNLTMAHLPREHVVAQPSLSPAQSRLFRARRALAGRGLMEAVTFSFLSESHAQAFGGGDAHLKLVNPISADLSDMRPSILPNLLAAAARNQDRGEADVAMFEISPVFLGDKPDEQRTACSGIRHGASAPREWHGTMRKIDVFDAKADAEAALAALGIRAAGIQTSTEAPDYFHPGRSGSLIQGRTKLASFGELHPRIADMFGLRGTAVGFEIHVDDVPMPKAKGPAKSLLSMSVFQPVSRDFAFIVDADVSAGDLLRAVKSGAGSLLADMRVFDLYQGDNIEAGKKSLAITITLSPTKATLTDEEIEKISESVIALAAKNCGAVLRG
ncbi:MAG: phenylalanine--tRNA ligase subunit beta, partial [Candidatus Puniceispirillum sp.]